MSAAKASGPDKGDMPGFSQLPVELKMGIFQHAMAREEVSVMTVKYDFCAAASRTPDKDRIKVALSCRTAAAVLARIKRLGEKRDLARLSALSRHDGSPSGPFPGERDFPGFENVVFWVPVVPTDWRGPLIGQSRCERAEAVTPGQFAAVPQLAQIRHIALEFRLYSGENRSIADLARPFIRVLAKSCDNLETVVVLPGPDTAIWGDAAKSAQLARTIACLPGVLTGTFVQPAAKQQWVPSLDRFDLHFRLRGKTPPKYVFPGRY